jgi:Spy/CpxP family protein refolding chaperone
MLKRLLIPTLILAIAVPVLAQKQARGLDLTQAQIEQLKAARQASKAQREAIRQETQQKRRALRELMSQSNPDATQLGNAMLTMKQSRAKAQQFRQQQFEEFKRTLTADQLKKLEEMQSRRKSGRRGI